MKLSEQMAALRRRMLQIADELDDFAAEAERTGKPADCEALADSRYDGYLPRGSEGFSGSPEELRHFAGRIRDDANS